MDAVYSGQAGVIALVEGAEARVRKAEHLQSEFILGREGTAYLFHGCNDVVVVRGAHEADVLHSFKGAWEADRALRLFLISLDPEEDTDIRAEACDWVEQLLANPHTQTFIENELYSRVLPQEVDIDLVFSSQRSTLLTNLVSKLLNDQKSIADRRRKWDELPISLFEDGDKKMFEETAIRRGAFRHLGTGWRTDQHRYPHRAVHSRPKRP